MPSCATKRPGCPMLDGGDCYCDSSMGHDTVSTQREMWAHLIGDFTSRFEIDCSGSPYTQHWPIFEVFLEQDNRSGFMPTFEVMDYLHSDSLEALTIVELNEEGSVMVALDKEEMLERLTVYDKPWEKQIKARIGPGKGGNYKEAIILG